MHGVLPPQCTGSRARIQERTAMTLYGRLDGFAYSSLTASQMRPVRHEKPADRATSTDVMAAPPWTSMVISVVVISVVMVVVCI